MEKKLFIIISCTVLILATILCTVFLLNTRDLEPTTDEIVFNGTWRVFKDGNADGGLEYFVFTESQVMDYRNGSITPTINSKYTIDGKIITIESISQKFSIESKTENVRLLYNQDVTYLLVKCSDNDYLSQPVFTQADLVGKYDVILHGNNVFGEESITFDGDRFICTRSGQEYLNTTFAVNNNTLSLITANGVLNFHICYNQNGQIRLTEIAQNGSYLAWELVAIKE